MDALESEGCRQKQRHHHMTIRCKDSKDFEKNLRCCSPFSFASHKNGISTSAIKSITTMSLSNTNVSTSGPELRGANITLETILHKTNEADRRTKIP